MPAAIVNSNNVIFSNGGGNFPVSASFAVGGIDNSTVSSMTFQVVRPTPSITGNTVIIKNEQGSSGEFALIPTVSNVVGYIKYNGDKTISITNPATITPVCSAHAMTTAEPSVTFNLPDTLMHFRVTNIS